MNLFFFVWTILSENIYSIGIMVNRYFILSTNPRTLEPSLAGKHRGPWLNSVRRMTTGFQERLCISKRTRTQILGAQRVPIIHSSLFPIIQCTRVFITESGGLEYL